jgi:hypothetical protein
MKVIEVKGNLFDTDKYANGENVVLAHCIASDIGMYGGIATQFIDRYDMKNKLLKHLGYASYRQAPANIDLVGDAIKIDNVYNLITKLTTGELPTIEDLSNSLKDMKRQMTEAGEHILAIPDMIGCGIDRLDRNLVLTTIQSIFLFTDITIYVVRL